MSIQIMAFTEQKGNLPNGFFSSFQTKVFLHFCLSGKGGIKEQVFFVECFFL